MVLPFVLFSPLPGVIYWRVPTPWAYAIPAAPDTGAHRREELMRSLFSFSRSLSSSRGIASLAMPLALVAVGAIGCASADSAEERQIAQLSNSITGIQNDNENLEKRVTKNDHAMTDDVDIPRVPAQAKTAASNQPPRALSVGEASDDGDGPNVNDDPDDTTPRPSIRIAGYATRITHKGARGSGGQEQVEESNAGDPDSQTPQNSSPSLRGNGASAFRVSALDPEAKPAYDAALALVNHKQYAQALDAFAAFLVKWPDHPNADNAMYWRGESYFAQGDIAHASSEFEGLVARFPMGNKVPDALLKLGLCQQRLGDPQKAKAYLDQLQREYPRSDAARKIPGASSMQKREDKK
jgi:tol-pal system protein YbgF